MKAPRIARCLAPVLLLAGCALLGPASIDESGPGVMRAGGPSPAAAQASAAPGNTKAQVMAALGRANAIRFDSGWEVWVYRWPGADRSTRGATEVVVLFDPQGVVKKSRLRRGER
jgi:hypothetical protein